MLFIVYIFKKKYQVIFTYFLKTIKKYIDKIIFMFYTLVL